MFLMDRFFNGAFLTFGLEVIAFAERDQVQNIHEEEDSPDKNDNFSGGSFRSNDIYFPTDDQMHLPQVRNIRGG